MPLDNLPVSDGEVTPQPDSEESFRAAGPAIPPPPVREPADTWPFPPHASPPDRVVPPGYELIGELGRGGMGIVYEARQLRPGRTVALKVLRPDRAGPGDAARLQSEAEAAARLQHPNIVQLYEVGEHAGSLYLCLEYVAGGSLTARLARGPLAAAEAARLVESLAEAMAYAHSRGVVHRDLKPGNVLLTVCSVQCAVCSDDAGAHASLHTAHRTLHTVPKVTDFGLAKRLDGGGDQTLSGAVLGTPSYLAPEQAAGRAKDAGPAADIYALGAVLYECLTGRPPFRAATPLQTLDQVRTLDPVPPRALQPATPRDLDVICLKCLQKEPGRRYASAAALADDLARFRRGEPIQARPVGPVGRLLKWVRRQPRVAALLAFSALAGVALIVGGIVGNVLLRAAAARAEARHRLSLEAIDRFLTRVGEERLTDVPEMEGVRRDLLEDALGFYRRLLAESNGRDPALRLEAGAAATRMGEIQRLLGRLDESKGHHRDAIALLGQLAAEDAGNPECRRRLADAHLKAGLTALAAGRPDDAEAAYRAAERLLRSLVAEQTGDPAHVAQLAAAMSNIAVVENGRGRLEAAEAVGREALALRQQLADAAPGGHAERTHLAMSHHNLCGVLLQLGRVGPAVGHGEKARGLLEALHAAAPREFVARSYLAACCNNLAAGYEEAGRPADAEATHRRALELRAALARDYPLVPDLRFGLAQSRTNLGDLLLRAGRYADAEPQYRAAIAAGEATAPGKRFDPVESRGNLALALTHLGRTADAATEFATVLPALESLAAAHPDQPRHAVVLAAAYVNRGELARVAEGPAAALPWCDKALATLAPVRTKSPAHADARATEVNARGTKAQALESLNRHADAIPEWDRIVGLSAPDAMPVMRFLRAAALAKAGDHRRAAAEVAAIAGEPRWKPAEFLDLARVVAAALGAVERDGGLASPERERLSADYAGQTAALLAKAVPAAARERLSFALAWFADAEFRPFFRRPECQAVAGGLFSGLIAGQ